MTNYVQLMKQDRLESEIAETRSKIRELGDAADAIIGDLGKLVGNDDADNVLYTVSEIGKALAPLSKIALEMEELENSIPGCGIEAYDVAGDR
jgi:hypothetical protein